MKKCINLSIILLICALMSSCSITLETPTATVTRKAFDEYTLAQYDGAPYEEINGNIPEFTDNDITTDSFEEYGELDGLGRCSVCTACVGQDIMPTEKRGSIGMVKPSGWQTVKYDFVDGRYLYNRCHLIGYQLTGENANPRNLITGTRYMNVDGMLPFEDEVADYVKSTGNHVMYRVTPVFQGDELVARGVQMEGLSVEDGGKSVQFNVFCYNVQPGVDIDYATGDSRVSTTTTMQSNEVTLYVVNTNSRKFHKPTCPHAEEIKSENKKEVKASRNKLISQGYKPCGYCKP